MQLAVPSRIQGDGYYTRIVNLGEDDPGHLAAKVFLGVLNAIYQACLIIFLHSDFIEGC